jgi:hypothetical protein
MEKKVITPKPPSDSTPNKRGSGKPDKANWCETNTLKAAKMRMKSKLLFRCTVNLLGTAFTALILLSPERSAAWPAAAPSPRGSAPTQITLRVVVPWTGVSLQT